MYFSLLNLYAMVTKSISWTTIILSLLFNLDLMLAADLTGCGAITSRSGYRTTEDPSKAVDNNVSTKWYNTQTSGYIWLQYQFCNNAAYAVSSYSLTSANDMPLRDPRTLNLLGSNDGINYTLLDTRSAIVFASRFQTLTFTISNTTPYKYYKFEFTANPGNDGIQLAEMELMTGSVASPPPAAGICTDGCGTITARTGNKAGEEAAKAFDNNTSTKWYNLNTTGTTWIQYQFCNGAAYAVNSYSIASANDMPLRDPRSVTLYGSNDGANYTLLDSRSSIAFTARFQKQTFSFTNSTPFKYYKFVMVANAGNDGLQLSEIEMMATAAPPAGTGPAAPSGLQALFTAPDMIDLAWTDNSSNETSFTIEQSLGSSFSPVQMNYTAAANTSRYVVKNLLPNTSYYFRIKSSNGSGSSGYSGTLTVKTGLADNFPLVMTAGKLSTKTGQPFLIVGDSPWYLIQGPDRNGAEKYLENRKLKGVTSLNMCIIASASNGSAIYDGNMPFLVTGDFSTPNPKYFEHVDFVLGKAREKGLQVFLYPAWLGYDTGTGHPQGWYSEVTANGTAKMYQYGRFLGQRYKDYKNIIWVMGGDCPPSAALDEIREMVRGIEEMAGPQIFSVQNARFQSGVTEYSGETWIDLNSTYADHNSLTTYLLADYNRNKPFYFIEGSYENTGASAVAVRGEMYKPVLMGANGSVYGNNPLYAFNSGWDDPGILDSQGARDLQRSGQFFRSRSWYNLVPDNAHTFLTAGMGDINTAAYAAAALMKDGSTGIIYTPDSRSLTVNLTKISGTQTHGWWYQPSTGTVQDLSVFSDSPARTFTPPSSGDWLLVLDDASKALAGPGTAMKTTETLFTPEEEPADNPANEIMIYPNPATDRLFVKNAGTDARIIIYDLQGKAVLSLELTDGSIDITQLPRGIFMVKIIDNDITTTNRMIKL
jgi:hypothetical protein